MLLLDLDALHRRPAQVEHVQPLLVAGPGGGHRAACACPGHGQRR